MTEEKDLIKKRGSYKGRLTNFSNYMNSFESTSLTSVAANELQLRVNRMETLFSEYDEVQLKLECLATSIDIQLSERTEFETQYFSAIAKAQDILNSFHKKQEDLGNERASISSASNHKLVKLPVIQLPKFSGSYENWLEFHDTFLSLIHSNDEIDEINKFHYLRSSLEGSAAVVVKSVEFCSKNYQTAWKLLCDRFDNKRLLLQNHVSAIFNIETITKESSFALKRMIDQLNKNLLALESLGEPVKQWDTLLIYIVSHKLDAKSYREWEEYKGRLDKDKPITLEAFLTFMRNRSDLLETLELSADNTAGRINTSHKNTPKLKTMSVQDSKQNTVAKCPKCSGDHYLPSCLQFLALSNAARLELLPSLKVCYNCLRGGHYANHCKKPGCKLCKRKHNTLVHVTDCKSRSSGDCASGRDEEDNATKNNKSIFPGNQLSPAAPVASHSGLGNVSYDSSPASVQTLSAQMVSNSRQSKHGMLATALVKVYDSNNKEHVARAMLDNGSFACLISQSFCDKLNLPTNQTNTSVLGINKQTTKIGEMCLLPIKSLNDTYSVTVNCFVLPSLTDDVPCRQIDLTDLKIPSDICLADPNFYKPAPVDIILGSEVFWDSFPTQPQIIRLGTGLPMLCETRFGFLVAGRAITDHLPSSMQCFFASGLSHTGNNDLKCNDDIQTQLTRFWQLEEVSHKSSHYSPEEKKCEEHFVENATRLADGRFCVRLPLKQSESVLGDSFQRAKYCMLSLERRIKTKPSFKALYTDFMAEYESLGHMSQGRQVSREEKGYIIPHHGILRESSTTKLRVVFHASSPSTSGVSLNDIQMVGPTVQDDLLSILIRFRQHRYIISSDVEKMYRQIWVHPDDRHLQKILWRSSETKPLLVHELNTVSYGTASAPFLATRCLKQIGLDCDDEKVKEVIVHDFYVDDLLTGGDKLTEVEDIRHKVTQALSSAGMNLRKWRSNEPRLLRELSQSSVDLNIGLNEPSKTLGLGWHPESDELYFPIGNLVPKGNTKRDMLSVIAQIFDPLGLLSPFVITMKMLLQRLWLQKISWEEELSPEITKQWLELLEGLPALNDIRVPRHVICNSHVAFDLHIFSDASERAYGACVYVRSVDKEGQVLVRLLIAKSRVSPIKPTTTPRLELCGALVSAHLYEKVMTSLRAQVRSTTFWTDSTIVLGWLKMMPSRLQPFVRNRVSDILEITGSCTWRHVPTDQNPADLISRGLHASIIDSLDLWWSGPSFLQQDVTYWPSNPITKQCDDLPETRVEVSLHVNLNHEPLIDFNRFSNLSRLIRAFAYALRFITKCRKNATSLSSTYLNHDELSNSLKMITKLSQSESFSEYDILAKKQNLPKKSKLLKFNPFLDNDNLMRVGGRLSNSEFPYEKKHPIILQSTHRFTKLLFNLEHKRLLHAPPQLLLATIKETYWPIGGRNLAKACYHQCVRCKIMKGQVIAPLMGNLPNSRLTPGGYPFRNVGVDYAGPLMAASRQGRGCALVKVYVAIFICFTTKAIHLELVGDLTSKTYLLALSRFMSRRGQPDNIYSDNGTAFVGAYNEITKFLKENCNSLAETLASEKTKFHFLPAYAPHFGGLWEAGVKSVKFHLQRVLGNCNLTYEQLNSTLISIEALLNSRPLTPLSSHPDDLSALTPGHFLVGRSLTSLLVQDLRDHTYQHLSRFHRIEQLRQHFWARWTKEYVPELQQRIKWRLNHDSLKNNSLVVLKENNLPPLKWRLGRIVAIHPGQDGISRVADVKTAGGVVRRAFSKICPLPVATDSV